MPTVLGDRKGIDTQCQNPQDRSGALPLLTLTNGCPFESVPTSCHLTIEPANSRSISRKLSRSWRIDEVGIPWATIVPQKRAGGRFEDSPSAPRHVRHAAADPAAARNTMSRRQWLSLLLGRLLFVSGGSAAEKYSMRNAKLAAADRKNPASRSSPR